MLGAIYMGVFMHEVTPKILSTLANLQRGIKSHPTKIDVQAE